MTALPGASPHVGERIPSTTGRAAHPRAGHPLSLSASRPLVPPALALTRRSLLGAGALGAATVVGLRPWVAAPAAAAPGHLLRSSYLGRVGEGFTVGSADLRLMSVDDLAGAAVEKSLVGSEDAFVLAFAGPLDAALAGGTHPVRHPALGRFELFVSEVGQPRSERRYEAVIDRSVRGPRSARKRTAAAATRPAAAPRVRLVRRIALQRTPRGARADVLLAATAPVERVYGRLGRGGKTLAVAATRVRGRRAVLRFRGARGLRPGSYTVTLVLVDAAGVASVRRRRVTLT
jgi:hypothetical protein